MNIDLYVQQVRNWISSDGALIGLKICLILVLLYAFDKVSIFLSNRLLSHVGNTDDKSIGTRSDFIITATRLILHSFIVIAGLVMILDTLSIKSQDIFITAGPVGIALRILLIFMLMILALKGTRLLSLRLLDYLSRNKDAEFKKRVDTHTAAIRFIASAMIVTISVIMILGEMGIDIGPIIAAAGVAGIAVGFGAQQLVQDIISGFFILLEDQIRVGDVVQIAGKSGLVEKINLRMTILRDLSGNVHYVRNGHIDVVTNMTKEYSQYVFDIGVSYREDVDEVIEAIKWVDQTMRDDHDFCENILEPIEILGLDQFADSAMIIKARTKTKPIKQWLVAREFNRRLKKRFDELNIEIPFPHITLYAGEDKQGQAPAFHITHNSET